MEKERNTFIGFVLALNNISLTLLVNFGMLCMLHAIFNDGIYCFFPIRIVSIGIIAMAFLVWIGFWYFSYEAYIEKKKEHNNP